MNANTLSQGLTSPSPELFRLLTGHEVYFKIGRQGNNQVNPRSKFYSPLLGHAHPALKAAVIHYEQQRPTPHTAPAGRLTHCRFFSAPVELDNQANTREWLVTTGQHCQPASPHKLATAWLLQAKDKGQPRVLMAERAATFKISHTRQQGYRNIEITLSGTLTIRQRQHEASCIRTWYYSGHHYVGGPDNITIWGTPANIAGSAYWYKPEHVYPELTGRLPVVCPRY